MNKKILRLGSDQGGTPWGLDINSLTTHLTITGMTGSGKTGVVLGLCEELIRNHVPSIILDIKGDMPNIFLQQDSTLEAMIEPKILTPGSDHGDPVNVASSLRDPHKITKSVTSLLDLVGVQSDPIRSRPHTFLSAILEDRHKKNQSCQLIDIIFAVQDPPFEHIGAMELEEVMSTAARKNLAAKLNNVLVAPSFKHWRAGKVLDIDSLIKPSHPSKTPVIVYSVAHLTGDDERTFAINLLLEELVSWMRQQNGANALQLTFVVDECYGLMPPRGGGDTKNALLTLLKQGRASGLGVILATQNPMDLDYKGMSNCGTWIVGRLQTANDRKRLVEGICSSVRTMDKASLEGKIGSLKPRQFLVAKGSKLIPFYSRTVSSTLKGPMNKYEIANLMPKQQSWTAKLMQFWK